MANLQFQISRGICLLHEHWKEIITPNYHPAFYTFCIIGRCYCVHIGNTSVAPQLALPLEIGMHFKVLHWLWFMIFISWMMERKDNNIKFQLHTIIAHICFGKIHDFVSVQNLQQLSKIGAKNRLNKKVVIYRFKRINQYFPITHFTRTFLFSQHFYTFFTHTVRVSYFYVQNWKSYKQNILGIYLWTRVYIYMN